MRKATRAVLKGLVALFALALIFPLFIPISTSGTLTYREAAGKTATFIKIDGYEVNFQEAKYVGKSTNQPLILLLHGFGANVNSWEPVINELSEFGDVIAYDRPAFGFTEKPMQWRGKTNPYSLDGQLSLISGLIDSFADGKKVILVGHSAGGQLAAEYALRNPGKVASVVLEDPAILTTGGASSGFAWLFNFPTIDHIAPLLVSEIATSGDELLRRSYADKSKLTDDVYARYHAPLKVIGWEKAFWQFAKAPRDFTIQDKLNQLSCGVLLITGDNDVVVPTSDTIKLNDLIAVSTLEVIANSGHLPHEEQPDKFIAAIGSNWQLLSR